MRKNWTSEPWEVIGFQTTQKPFCRVSIAKVVFDPVEECREYVADFQGVSTNEGKNRTMANANRAVACINALAGLNPEAVSDVINALEKLTQAADSCGNDLNTSYMDKEIEFARIALSKLKEV